ncbi:MAG: hypothetical protein SAJ12_06550 [Jaaginema sp. PMC 1079.18]|nr:hypothetical protein [Jaaginema sp. PMC 1080.18]MEC4850653.1 hypothetical protein [Jaaginema sp. PMC 1079.18]MEC4866663.1 hypothetical protein [Jaaginema sp. PMC 1078.18]
MADIFPLGSGEAAATGTELESTTLATAELLAQLWQLLLDELQQFKLENPKQPKANSAVKAQQLPDLESQNSLPNSPIDALNSSEKPVPSRPPTPAKLEPESKSLLNSSDDNSANLPPNLPNKATEVNSDSSQTNSNSASEVTTVTTQLPENEVTPYTVIWNDEQITPNNISLELIQLLKQAARQSSGHSLETTDNLTIYRQDSDGINRKVFEMKAGQIIINTAVQPTQSLANRVEEKEQLSSSVRGNENQYLAKTSVAESIVKSSETGLLRFQRAAKRIETTEIRSLIEEVVNEVKTLRSDAISRTNKAAFATVGEERSRQTRRPLTAPHKQQSRDMRFRNAQIVAFTLEIAKEAGGRIRVENDDAYRWLATTSGTVKIEAKDGRGTILTLDKDGSFSSAMKNTDLAYFEEILPLYLRRSRQLSESEVNGKSSSRGRSSRRNRQRSSSQELEL